MAAADPELAIQLARRVAFLYQVAEKDLQQQVARRLARGVEQPGWAEDKLVELTRLRQAADRRVAALEKEVTRTVADALAQAAGGLRDQPFPIRTNTRAVEVLAEQTLTKLRATHFQLLRSVQDEYRTVVARTASQVATGQTTTRVAAQRTVSALARQGLTGFVDSKGRAWKLDRYAEMAVRTASAQAMVGARLNEYVDAGRSLVIVSNSPDECDKCEPWEDKILAIDGAPLSPEDRGLAVATVKEATKAGLFHPNCTHDLRPYIHGLTKSFTSTTDKAGEAQRKTETRAQRKLVEAQRQDVVTEPFGDSPERQRVKAKLAGAEDEAVEAMAARYRLQHGTEPRPADLARFRRQAGRGQVAVPPE